MYSDSIMYTTLSLPLCVVLLVFSQTALSLSLQGPAESGAHSSYSHIPALKEGEKIKISIGGKSKHTGSGEKAHAATTGVTTGAGAGKGGFGLKPPPPPGSVVHFQGGAPASAAEASAPVASSAGSAAADEDWGDFN